MEEVYQTSIPDSPPQQPVQNNIPAQEPPPTPTSELIPAPNKSKKRLTVLLIVLAACVALGASYVFWVRPFYFGGGFDRFKAEQNDLRIYRTPDAYQEFAGGAKRNAAAYLLADAAGNKVGEFSYVYKLDLITTVGEDSFLLVGDYLSAYLSVGEDMYKTLTDQPYTLASKDGTRTLTDMPASMVSLTKDERGGLPKITGIGGDKVAYQYCKSSSEIKQGEDPYQCDLRQVDLKTRNEKVTPQPDELNQYEAKLLAFSSDKKSGYFMGLAKDDKEAFQKKVTALTGGGYVSENDPIVKEIYKLNMNPSVIKVNMASGKIQSIKRIEVRYNYYNKFWISPNGEDLIYVTGGRGEITHVNIANGKQSTIKLPGANQAAEPWGGGTTTYDPLYSPDGNYMAYVTYDFQTGKEYMGIIDLKAKKAKEVASRTLAEFGQEDKGAFGNMRWYANNQLEMTYDDQNYRVDAAKGTLTKLDKTHGLLFGLADGAR